MGNQSKKFKKRELVAKGFGTVGHITRNNLERMGGLLDDMSAKSQKTSHYNAVDLDNFDTGSADNFFSQQTLKASQQLLGPRFATYGKFAKKVVPDSLFHKVTDSAFSQVANLASSWSKIDLPNEHRFEGIQGLDEQQRNALARDIANQNRALAILGGVTGLAGLPGMLADTLWLLLVSLRTVYQLATVYDKPLTGKQGVKMAYAVLTNADLSKMQEKQSILAGLGVATGLLNNADNQGFRKELKNMGVNNNSVSYYAEQIDKIAAQFNINVDGMNLGWITKFLPVISVGVSGHYNQQLINEVIGVANATFGPEPKEALMNDSKVVDDKNNEDKSIANEDHDTKEGDAKEDNTKDTNDHDSKENDSKTKASDSKDNGKKNVLDDAKADSKGVTDKASATLDSNDAKSNDAKNTETKSNESKNTESKSSNESNTTVDTHKAGNKQKDSDVAKVKPLDPKPLETASKSDNK